MSISATHIISHALIWLSVNTRLTVSYLIDFVNGRSRHLICMMELQRNLLAILVCRWDHI